MEMIEMLFGFGCLMLHVWEGKESVVFAQASDPRLSENSRKLTQVSAQVVAQVTSFNFERRVISLRREDFA